MRGANTIPTLEELIEEFHGQFNLLYFAVGVGWGARTFSGIETNTREEKSLVGPVKSDSCQALACLNSVGYDTLNF